jgi:hypothetical protein
MDPYLESPTHWSDFHARFIFTLAEAVNQQLPKNYIARISEHVMSIAPTLREEGDDPVYLPDVAVLGSGEASAAQHDPTGQPIESASVMTPVMLENIIFVDDYVESYLHVVRLPEMELVTAVELFSPTNKYGEGRGIYMKKRREFLSQKVNLVELDLIRAGGRLQFGKPLPPGHYHAFVSPIDRRPQTEVYTWSIRDRLPTIPIPLRPSESNVHVDLSTPFSAAYDAGRYRRIVDYEAAPPAPSLSSPDAEWVRQITQQSA